MPSSIWPHEGVDGSTPSDWVNHLGLQTVITNITQDIKWSTAWSKTGSSSIKHGPNDNVNLSGSVGFTISSLADLGLNVVGSSFRMYVKINNLPAVNHKVLILGNAPWEEMGWYLTDTGDFHYNYGTEPPDETIDANLVAGDIFRIESAWDPNAGQPKTRFFLKTNQDGTVPDFTSMGYGLGDNYDGSRTIYSGVCRRYTDFTNSTPYAANRNFHIDAFEAAPGNWVGPAGAPPPPATQKMGWGIPAV